jgi:hypothetical protein
MLLEICFGAVTLDTAIISMSSRLCLSMFQLSSMIDDWYGSLDQNENQVSFSYVDIVKLHCDYDVALS